MDLQVRNALPNDLPWIERLVEEHFGSSRVVTRGRLFQPRELVNLIVSHGDAPAGVVGYAIQGRDLEVVLLIAVVQGQGVGTRLLEEARLRAVSLGCSRMWLVTTNDNEPAIRLYESWGMRLAAVHKDAVAESRKLKPEIPKRGHGGTPIRDELEFERLL